VTAMLGSISLSPVCTVNGLPLAVITHASDNTIPQRGSVR
jgi:hypothetical protein